MSHDTVKVVLERMYNSLVKILGDYSAATIPRYKKDLVDPRIWTTEACFSCPNSWVQASVTSAKIWKDTGKPRAGLIFSKYKDDKLQYKRRICEERAKETSMITNDLHQALLKKSGQTFWKCWKSKFGSQWMIEMAILVVV